MSKMQRDAAFYWGASTQYDLDSDDVDLITEAAGLSLDVHGAAACVAAIKKYLARNASDLAEAAEGVSKHRGN